MALDQATLQTLLNRLGIVTGSVVAQQVSDALNVSGTDIQDLQNKIATIQGILDADPSTPEFDVAQNIITTITNLQQELTDAKDPAVAGSLAAQIADNLNQLTALATIVENMKAGLGLNADGTITLPDATSDTAGIYALLADGAGVYPATLLDAVKNLASKTKAQFDTINAATSSNTTNISTLTSRVDTIDASVSDLDALVSSFCAGVQSGLGGATDPSCTSSGSGL